MFAGEGLWLALTRYLSLQVPSWLQTSFPLVPLHRGVQPRRAGAQGGQVSPHPAKQPLCRVPNGVQHDRSAGWRGELPRQPQEEGGSEGCEFQWLLAEELQDHLRSLKFPQLPTHIGRWLFLKHFRVTLAGRAALDGREAMLSHLGTRHRITRKVTIQLMKPSYKYREACRHHCTCALWTERRTWRHVFISPKAKSQLIHSIVCNLNIIWNKPIA